MAVTLDNGKTITYALDVGYAPYTLFPLSDEATRIHDLDKDGKTDVFSLPVLNDKQPTADAWREPYRKLDCSPSRNKIENEMDELKNSINALVPQ